MAARTAPAARHAIGIAGALRGTSGVAQLAAACSVRASATHTMRKETQPKISIIEQHSTTTDSLVLRQRMYAFSQVLLLLRPAAAAARCMC